MSSRQTGFGLLVSLVVMALALAACGDSDPYERDERFISGSPLDLARSFGSLDELLAYEGGPLVVVGMVESRDKPQPEPDATPSRFMGLTHSEVRVSEVVANGGGVGPGDLLEVRQPGNPTQEFREWRLLREDEPVLLFLVRSEGFDPWFIAGGPHGHYTIDGDYSDHANFEDDHPFSEFVEGRTVEEVTAKIRELSAP